MDPFLFNNIVSKTSIWYSIRPKFSITADLDSKYVLDAIKTYFNCGKVSINLKNHSSEF